MNRKRAGLGKNLSALLGQSDLAVAEKNEKDSLVHLSVDSLQAGAYQPRTDFDELALQELAESIAKQGVLQPLVVRVVSSGKYEIIAGERRFRACKLAGLNEIPAIIRAVDDETAMAMALVENLQREDLNAAEQAKAMARLINEFDLTHQQVADLLGKSRTAVSNFLRLLTLSDVVMQMLENGDLDMGHARALLSLPMQLQEEVARQVVAKNLSVRETEQLVKRFLKPQPKLEKAPLEIPRHITEQSQSLAKSLQTSVEIKSKKNGKGAIMIQYKNPKHLEALLKALQD